MTAPVFLGTAAETSICGRLANISGLRVFANTRPVGANKRPDNERGPLSAIAFSHLAGVFRAGESAEPRGPRGEHSFEYKLRLRASSK